MCQIAGSMPIRTTELTVNAHVIARPPGPFGPPPETDDGENASCFEALEMPPRALSPVPPAEPIDWRIGALGNGIHFTCVISRLGGLRVGGTASNAVVNRNSLAEGESWAPNGSGQGLLLRQHGHAVFSNDPIVYCHAFLDPKLLLHSIET